MIIVMQISQFNLAPSLHPDHFISNLSCRILSLHSLHAVDSCLRS